MTNKINDLPTKDIKRFWQHMIRRHDGERVYCPLMPQGMRWHPVDGRDLNVVITVGIDFIRVFVRGEESANPSQVAKKLDSIMEAVSATVGVPMRTGEKDRFFSKRLLIDMNNEDNWDEAADWLWDQSQQYEKALVDGFGAR